MHRLRAAFASVAVLVIAGCHHSIAAPAAEQPLTKLPRPLSANEQVVLQSSNAFAFNLFAAVDSAAGPDSNVFISPLSASVALGMATVGAAGTTLDSMQSVLGYRDMSVDAMGGAYQSLIALLQTVDTNVTFHLANSIWYSPSITLLSTFTNTVTNDFDARIQSVDFTNPAAATAINQWVDSSTSGKIPTLIDSPLDPHTVAFLVNAIYFYGRWSAPFDANQTRDSTFTTSTGAGASLPMMHTQLTAPYVTTAAYAAVDLPYGLNAFRMTIILPASGVSLDSVVHAMRAGGWAALSASLDSEASAGALLAIAVPKFQLTWGDGLTAPLTSLGMGVAFNDGADFSNLAAGGAQFLINEVIQKTFVQVDERGTTAAAATGVGIVPTDVQEPKPFSVNHPFLYIIRERFSGAMLFVGAFTHPPAAS